MTDKSHSILDRAGLDREAAVKAVGEALSGADDGELYLEFSEAESLLFDNGRLKAASFDTNQGFGLRAVAGEAQGFAHSGEISEPAIRRAGDAVQAVKAGHRGTYAEAPRGTNRALYGDQSPLGSPTFAEKVKLLETIDAYARGRDPRVRQVTASLAGSYQEVEILRADGSFVRDVRPMVRVNVSVVVGEGDRQESGGHGMGGREGFGAFVATDRWQFAVDEALRQALVNLDAVPAPAGTFDVVLGPGWPGILLHEAVGHGLEGDFNRKGESAFAGLMGQRVASPGVTVVDDGTIANRRGSLTIDDEGTPTQSTTLIEDGILVGYMQDRQNARLMGMQPTGNGRRQSYAHLPMPRMTNTIMLAGKDDPEGDPRLGQGRHLRRLLRRRPGRHHLGQVRVLLHRGLPHPERRHRAGDQGRHADRQRPGCAHPRPHDRQRHAARPRRRHLRQERPGRAGRRRPADAAHRPHHRRRHGDLRAIPRVNPSDARPSPTGSAGLCLGAEPAFAVRGINPRCVVIFLAGHVVDALARPLADVALDRAGDVPVGGQQRLDAGQRQMGSGDSQRSESCDGGGNRHPNRKGHAAPAHFCIRSRRPGRNADAAIAT